MKAATTLYRAHQCSKCPGDTEYYCVSCPCELCPQCKESHVQDLQTIDHDVVSHHDKINYIPTQEICVRHPRNVYKKYCQTCEHPVCYHCRKHRNHTQLDVREAFQTKRQQHLRTIHTIRCESLFYRHVLLTGTKSDVKICHTKFIHFQQNLKDLIKKVKHDLMYNVFCNFDFKHRCTIQKIEMSRHIVSLQTYEHIYEQSEIRPLQFLSSIKTTLPKIHLTLHTGQLSVTESLNKEDIMESLSEIKTADRGKRRLQTECLLKLMSGAEFHQSLTLTGVDGCSQMYVKGCLHMSIATPNHVWVSDSGCNLVLTDTTGVPLHCVKGPCSDISFGIHTVNSESELIHIDKNYNINILSKDGKTTTTYIERTDSTWEPRCVYWSPSTGDLLVGMYREITEYTGTGKVTRYNQSGQLTQTIEHNNKGLDWYRYPIYITENNNGDVVVSDSDYLLESGSVVVTEREGKHRFSYTGHPSESRLRPFGLCTDALSHILVCDGRTHTVQMLNRDGKFLSHLLIRPSGVFSPHSLSYDVNTHRLWVGSWCNNNVVVYRYMDRQDASTDPATGKEMESLNEIQTSKTKELQRKNKCQLQQISAETLYQSLTIFVGHCFHISYVTTDRVWVRCEVNVILKNRTDVILHRVNDPCRCFYQGIHTVNSESELIYIDEKYHIKKLSKDMKTTTTFIESTEYTWEPRCVYWSPSAGDLLVGMYKKEPRDDTDNSDDTDDTDDSDTYRKYDADGTTPKTGKITRYNQNGQLTQTIQYDNKGLELYRQPNYITENNNGDVVVSDSLSAVVVTERGGRHRFSYTGNPPELNLTPLGICTDAMSHILVCCQNTKTVQVLDKNGRFLFYLQSQGIVEPCSLSYDSKANRLWVGLYLTRYTIKQDTLQDEPSPCPDEDILFSSTPALEWR